LKKGGLARLTLLYQAHVH